MSKCLNDKVVSLVQALFVSMSDSERLEFRDECMDGYCEYCGTDILPCHCGNDE